MAIKLTTILILIASIFILINPAYFHVESIKGAIFWMFLLSLEEICAPYLDFQATNSSNLLAKEIGVGIGGIASLILLNDTNLLFILCITLITAGILILHHSPR